MVFLGGAVLANIVRGLLSPPLRTTDSPHLDGGQRGHVGFKAGVGGIRRSSAPEAGTTIDLGVERGTRRPF